MTDATYAPDSPDWFSGGTGGVILQKSHVILGGDQVRQGLSGATGCVVLLEGTLNDVAAALLIDFTAGFDGGGVVFASCLSAAACPIFPALAIIDLPAYGGGIIFTNLDPVNSVAVVVTTTNRVITDPRIEVSTLPGRVFANLAGFVAATAQYLSSLDQAGFGYANNGSSGVTATSSGDGQLDFHYWDASFTERIIPVTTLAAGVTKQLTVPLPQCVGALWFTPVGDDPAGEILVQMYPAQI